MAGKAQDLTGLVFGRQKKNILVNLGINEAEEKNERSENIWHF
jgi:hypothetical protein